MLKLAVTSEDGGDIVQDFQIDDCLWSEVIIHYINLQQNHKQIGRCFKIINENLHKRSSNVALTGRVIDRLTELNKLFGYFCDVANECVMQMLETITKDEAAPLFLEFLKQNSFKKCNIVEFLNNFYKADFTASDYTAEVWTKMRPISDEGKTRGYSGPSELPLLLLTGGYKACRGDIVVCNNLIEIKGDGGRIGETSKWISNKVKIDKFINQFAKEKNETSELQTEFTFDSNDSIVRLDYDFSMLPCIISQLARAAYADNLIKCKEDAMFFLGSVQLLEYITYKHNDWFVLFKHPGKKTVPFGTAFVLESANIKYDAQNCLNLCKVLRQCGVTFSPCYDSGGYKIKFTK